MDSISAMMKDLLPPLALEFLFSLHPIDVASKTACGFVLMCAIFFFLWFSSPSSVHHCNKLRAAWSLKSTSIVHAIIVSGLSIWALFYEEGMREITAGVLKWDADAVRTAAVHTPSNVCAATLPLTMAYFILDLFLVSVWEGKWQQHVPVFFHHGLSLLTWPAGLCQPACHWFLLCCLSMEFSTPLVQLRWFFGKGHPLYVINGFLMTVSFVVCRLYPMMPYNLWAIFVSSPHSAASGLPLAVRIAASALVLPNVLNLFWGYKMVTGLLGVLLGKKKSSSASAAGAAGRRDKAPIGGVTSDGSARGGAGGKTLKAA